MKIAHFLLYILVISGLFQSVESTKRNIYGKKLAKHSKKPLQEEDAKVATRVFAVKAKYGKKIEELNEKLNNVSNTITYEQELLSYRQQNIREQLQVYEKEKKEQQGEIQKLANELEHSYELNTLAMEFQEKIISRSHQIIQRKDWLKLEEFAQKLGIMVNDTTQGKGSHSTGKFVDLENDSQKCHVTLSSKKRYCHLKHLLELLTKKLPNEAEIAMIEHEKNKMLQNYNEVVNVLNVLLNNATKQTQAIETQLKLMQKHVQKIDALILKTNGTMQNNLRRLAKLVRIRQEYIKKEEANYERLLISLKYSPEFYQLCIKNGFTAQLNVFTTAQFLFLKQSSKFQRLYSEFCKSIKNKSSSATDKNCRNAAELVLDGGVHVASVGTSTLISKKVVKPGCFLPFDTLVKIIYLRNAINEFLLNNKQLTLNYGEFDQLLIKGILSDIYFIFYELLWWNLDINLNNILCEFVILRYIDDTTYQTIKHLSIEIVLHEKIVKQICRNSEVVSLIQQILKSRKNHFVNNDILSIINQVISYLDAKANYTKLLQQKITVDNIQSYHVLPENSTVYNERFLQRMLVAKEITYKRYRLQSEYNISSLWIYAAKHPKYRDILSSWYTVPSLTFFRLNKDSYAYQLITNWSLSLK